MLGEQQGRSASSRRKRVRVDHQEPHRHERERGPQRSAMAADIELRGNGAISSGAGDLRHRERHFRNRGNSIVCIGTTGTNNRPDLRQSHRNETSPGTAALSDAAAGILIHLGSGDQGRREPHGRRSPERRKNVITYDGRPGVHVQSQNAASVRATPCSRRGGLGIDLGPTEHHTENDNNDADADRPSCRISRDCPPHLGRTVSSPTILGTLDGASKLNVPLFEFFSNTDCDPCRERRRRKHPRATAGEYRRAGDRIVHVHIPSSHRGIATATAKSLPRRVVLGVPAIASPLRQQCNVAPSSVTEGIAGRRR